MTLEQIVAEVTAAGGPLSINFSHVASGLMNTAMRIQKLEHEVKVLSAELAALKPKTP